MKQGAGLSYGGRKSEWERGEEAGKINEKSLVFLPPRQLYNLQVREGHNLALFKHRSPFDLKTTSS